MNGKISLMQAIEQLGREPNHRFVTVMQNGSMSVEYYAPRETDRQTPHQQDELYIIASGSGIFFRNGERIDCNRGDVLFVPAGMEHRFENFTTDFATWVVFYGPVGGETGL